MDFYEKFRREIFCKKLNFEQTCHNQGSKKIFQFQFLVNELKSMYFYEAMLPVRPFRRVPHDCFFVF